MAQYTVKPQPQIRDDILRSWKAGLIRIGIPTPNIGPKSDMFVRASGVANELAVIGSNNVVTVDQLMPDTAAGSNLDRWLTLVGLSRRPALPSYGLVTATCSVASTVVATGAQLTDTNGLRYQVTVGGTYAAVNGQFQVPIIAIDTGKATNHANGDTLIWVTAPPFCQTNVVVGIPGGLDELGGGADSEVGNDEPPRARLFDRLQNPPRGGNASDTVAWAQQANAVVQGAWCYPALLGPATTFVLVAQEPQGTAPFTNTSKNRGIASVIVNSQIGPYVAGLLPEHAFSVVASVGNQAVDVAIQLTLPSAPTATPPGPGGGWLDGSPWPSSIGGSLPVKVTSVTSTTQFTVNALSAPTNGVSHIAWLSPLNWTVTSAIVTNFSGTPGAYLITVDTPMVGIASGNFIWPQSQNQATYIAAILDTFANLGPGEWVQPTSVVYGRSFRHPTPSQSWPSSLTNAQLKGIIGSGPEVLDASWLYRSMISPPLPMYPPTVSFSAQQLTSAGPSILVPQNIALLAA
jgi:uncharacterized phage protein gp47/JayE